MKKFFRCLGACLKLVFWVAVLIGLLFLIKKGIGFMSEAKDSLQGEEATSSAETDYTVTDLNVSFEEIYTAYKDNELLADDLYKDNRYQITAKINGMETGGLMNMTGGATLTMEVQVDDTIVFFLAEFEKEQEEALKEVSVGDTIVFEGTCLNAGSWKDCELVD